LTRDQYVWAGVVLTPLIISGGQILFRITGMRLHEKGGPGMLRMFLDPYFIAAMVIYVIGTMVWVNVLRHMPLGRAYPFMALTFVLVPLASWLILGEVLTLRYWIGAALIIAGMLIINAT
jgi:drug/metabolite transporter (DMT)-like permease